MALNSSYLFIYLFMLSKYYPAARGDMLLPVALKDPQLCVKFHHHELQWCMQSNDRKCMQKGFERVAAVIVFITWTRFSGESSLCLIMWQQCIVRRVQTLNVSKIFWHCREKENTLIQVCVSLPLTAIEVCYCTDWSKCRVCSIRQQVNGFLYQHGYSIPREFTLKETKYWNIYMNSLLLAFLVTRTICCIPFTPSHIYFTTSHFWKPCC